MKTCIKCGSSFSGKRCLDCHRAISLAYYYANKDKVIEKVKEYREKNSEKIKKYNADKRKDPIKKKLYAEKASIYYQNNKEKVKQNASKWKKNNKEKFKASQRKWSANNMDYIREKNRIYRLANLSKYAAFRQNRRVRQKNGDGISKGLYDKLMCLQTQKCAICKASLKDRQVHMDHIKPLYLGGENSDHNIQLLCKRCNLKKGHKDPIEFMQSKGFLL